MVAISMSILLPLVAIRFLDLSLYVRDESFPLMNICPLFEQNIWEKNVLNLFVTAKKMKVWGTV